MRGTTRPWSTTCRARVSPWSSRRVATTSRKGWPPSSKSAHRSSEGGEATVTAPARGSDRLGVGPDTPVAEVVAAVQAWIVDNVPDAWREAAADGGAAAIRAVRPRAEYEAWYPMFGR